MALHRVETTHGIVEGVPGNNASYTVFKGIPYAAPPVGNNRWREPQPVEDWKGVYRAYTFKGICPQVLENDAEVFSIDNPYPFEKVSEDCLYLNVWTPADSDNERLPVMFVIHGGANVTGYGHQMVFDGEAFCREKCIFVTFTWRVNVFGWLVHKELSEESPRHISGNYGLLDQVAALNWVHDNIAAFGGNPDNVTVSGESAGGSSTFCLCLTPLAKGLFQHAIMQSGGGYNIFTIHDFQSLSEMENNMNLKTLLGVDTIEEARKIPDLEVERLINRKEAVGAYLPMQAIDGYVFPKFMNQMCWEHSFHDVDYMIGYTKDESFMYMYPDDRQAFIDGAKLEYGKYADRYIELCPFLNNEEAFHKHLFSRNAEMLKTSAVNFCEDLEYAGKNAYMYCFTRDLGDGYGAYHSSELWYEFGTLGRKNGKYTGYDYDLSAKMVKYWTNFAKTGNPNGTGLPKWRPYSRELPEAMELGDSVGMRDFGINERILFRKKFVRGKLS